MFVESFESLRSLNWVHQKSKIDFAKNRRVVDVRKNYSYEISREVDEIFSVRWWLYCCWTWLDNNSTLVIYHLLYELSAVAAMEMSPLKESKGGAIFHPIHPLCTLLRVLNEWFHCVPTTHGITRLFVCDRSRSTGWVKKYFNLCQGRAGQPSCPLFTFCSIDD